MFPTRLRTRLLLMAAIAVLPALVVIIVEQSTDRERERSATLQENLRLTRVAADRQASVFVGAQRLLQTLARVPELHGQDESACSRLLPAVLQDHPGYLNLAVVDTDGVVWCSSEPAAMSLRVEDRGWFRRAMETRRTVIGEYQVGRTTGAADVVIAYPMIAEGGHVERILAAALELSELGRILSTVNLAPGRTLTMFERDRTILARTPDGANWNGTKIQSTLPMERLIAGEKEETYETVGIDGVRRLYATVIVDTGFGSPDLFMSVGMNSATATARANRVAQQQFWLLAILSAVVLTVAVVGGQMLIVAPVNALRTVTKRLASGDLTARATLSGGVEELSALGDTVNAMAMAIEARERERDEALQDRRLLASIVDESEDAILSKRLDGVITSWNRGAERLFGYTAAEIIGQSVSLLTPPDRVDELQRILERLRQGEHLKGFQTMRRRKDGSEVPVSLTLSPITDGNGLIVGASSIARDVTDLVRAADALRDTEERMRFALEASRVGVWEINLSTGTAYWSSTCETMHGLAPGSFGGTFAAFVDCIHADDRKMVEDAVVKATQERHNADLEYRTVWPDGSVRQISATGRIFYDDEGRPVRGAGISVDVTDRRSLEDQLRQAQKMEAVGQLAGGIAHDFNNVLTAILGNAEFLMDDLPAEEEKLRAEVHEISVAAERAATLTRQLLAFSRKQLLEPRVLHLGDVVGGVAPMLRRLLGETIRLHEAIADSGHVKADPGQMQQILVNLAVNARDAMPQGGRLTIETADVVLDETYARQHPSAHLGPHVMLAVSDSGHGMDAATQKRIFEPFFTTKPPGQGTGLGLATVYGIVKQSEGQVWVYSEVGRGTTFKIYLPRTYEAETTTPVSPQERHVRGDETILLVEDEEFVRAFVQKVLARHGYTIHAMADAAHAVAFASAHHGRIDLVLSDVVLPDQNGRVMAEQVQALHPESRILYMSGYTDGAIAHDGVLQPEMAFLQKPFAAGTLARRVRDVLDARVT